MDMDQKRMHKQAMAIRKLIRVFTHSLDHMVGFRKTTCESGVVVVLLRFNKHWFDEKSIVATIGVQGGIRNITVIDSMQLSKHYDSIGSFVSKGKVVV
jgi:hypothetical protein